MWQLRNAPHITLILIILLSCLLPLPVYAQGGGEGPTTHTVAPGETLFRIALNYGVSLQALASVNGITDYSKIRVGQLLIIPGTGAANGTGGAVAPAPTEQPFQSSAGEPAPAPTQVAPAVEPASGVRKHVVKRGEGLATIGRLYNIPWTAIATANNLTNPNTIYPGMVLIIPDSDGTAPGPESNSSVSAPAAPDDDGKLILVVLREQRVYVYEDGKLLKNVLVSTGLPGTPTVQGDFRIYLKYKSQLMSGQGYYLPGVPWVMYFYRDYGLHGTYWHKNFGRPMSHGCVNMPTDEAKWLYDWSEIGTRVKVRW